MLCKLHFTLLSQREFWRPVLLGRFLKLRKAGLVDSSLISREMDVALFLYRNICTGGAFVSQIDQNLLGVRA